MIDRVKGRGPVLPLGAALAVAGLALGGASAAEPRAPSASEVVRDALTAQGPVITDEERALIRAKCGDEEGPISLSSHEGVVICHDGSEVDDPELRAVMTRILARANDHVRNALGRRQVADAISGEAVERARVELAELGRLDSLKTRADVQAALDAARVELAGLDLSEALASAQAALADVDIARALREAEQAIDRTDIDRILREAEAELARERRSLEERSK